MRGYKPTVLMIMDGYGLNDRKDGNAVAMANTPVVDGLMRDYPFVKGNASGLAVGLPDGQMGNSEVGHMNMTGFLSAVTLICDIVFLIGSGSQMKLPGDIVFLFAELILFTLAVYYFRSCKEALNSVKAE